MSQDEVLPSTPSEKDMADPTPPIPDIENQETSPEVTLTLRQERLYLSAIAWCMFLIGWFAGATGPLLPTIQSYYHINYTIVSMIFVSGCIGTVPGSLSSGYLTDRFGFGKLFAAGAALQLVTYAVLSIPPPFPAFCVTFAVNGLAGALQMASCNIFLAGMPNAPKSLGIAHAMFGIGALLSPLVATQFAQLPTRWSFQYITTLFLAIINLALCVGIFRFRRQEELLPSQTAADKKSGGRKLWDTLKLPVLNYMQLFIFVYVGVEITSGGWIVTFLEVHRGGGPSSGYVTSGFFAGLALGRLILLPINRLLGHDRVIFLYTLIAIGLELTIWFVPSLIENAVAISLVGLVIGPFYPLLVGAVGRKIPPKLVAGAIGVISASGQIGAAAFPFATGALAAKFGVLAMQPLIVAMLASLIVLWGLVVRTKLHPSIEV